MSVVMPVHNALPHLDAAIQSIVDQTFGDFEFVILDDASTDGSTQVLEKWAVRDSRIRLLRVERNLGPALSSDMVARAARAPIVARMDGDDVSYSNRLEWQLKVLSEHRDVGVVGGLSEIINAEGCRVRRAEPWRLVRHSFFPPFGNGPMTYRRELFERIGGYRRECEFWEDHDLVLRMAAASKIMVIPHAIYQVRQSSTSTRLVSQQERLERAVDLMYRSTDRLQRNQDYEDLLKLNLQQDAKVDPRVFISLGSVALWAGGHPRLFRRFIRRGKLTANFRTIAAFIWTAWASLSPKTLRSFLGLLLVTRNGIAARMIHSDEPVIWKPGSGAIRRA